MRGLGILLLVVVFLVFVWPAISRWLKRKAMDKAEDYLRRSMGMPPRDKNSRKKNSTGSYSQDRYNHSYQRQDHNRSSARQEPIIPKEYAEDVEFVETKDFSSTETHTSNVNFESFHESQISDADWTEIKKPRSK